MEEKAKVKKRLTPGRLIWRIFAFLGVTLLSLVIVFLGVIWVMEKGPSKTLTGMFCRSVRETSAIRWVSGIFLSDEELQQYITESSADVVTQQTDTSLITVPEVQEKVTVEENVELIDIFFGSCRGKLLIVHDPKTVILGTSSDNFQNAPGLQLTDMAAKYDAIAGTNAGGFIDDAGTGNGGTPTGVVIVDNKIIYGYAGGTYNLIGLDGDGILHVGTMTGQQALDSGIKWGVSFVTHDGIASSLIINGEIQTQNISSGVNPRTAIGQRADGAILLLVLDGRSITTIGATLSDVCNIMLEYGAVNAGNLDGGSSSVMVYDGEIINNCSSVTGPRRVPTGFMVLKEAQ